MRVAQLENGVVINTIEIDSVDSFENLVDGKDAAIGDIWDGEKFIKPAPAKPTLNDFENAIQNFLDSVAVERGYDGILSASTYASAPNQFQEEGIRFLKWRADVWSAAHLILNDVNSGNRVAPTIKELLLELPYLEVH